jgi:hypothetical protein
LAIAKLRAVVKKAVRNFSECDGYAKLEEAVRALEVRDRFDLSRMPSPLPDDNNAMFDFLGVDTSAASRTIEQAILLRNGWNGVRSAWKSGLDTPALVAKFWQSYSATSPHLSSLAIRFGGHWQR